MSILQKSAEILVECGMYAEFNEVNDGRKVDHYIAFVDEFNGTRDFRKPQKIDPFADTLEGRRQADAIEDYLREVYWDRWHSSESYSNRELINQRHQWRLDRIKWCLEQLVKEEEE